MAYAQAADRMPGAPARPRPIPRGPESDRHGFCLPMPCRATGNEATRLELRRPCWIIFLLPLMHIYAFATSACERARAVFAASLRTGIFTN